MGSRSNSDDKNRNFPAAKQKMQRVEVPLKQRADKTYEAAPKMNYKKTVEKKLMRFNEPKKRMKYMGPKEPVLDLKTNYDILPDGSKFE